MSSVFDLDSSLVLSDVLLLSLLPVFVPSRSDAICQKKKKKRVKYTALFLRQSINLVHLDYPYQIYIKKSKNRWVVSRKSKIVSIPIFHAIASIDYFRVSNY